MILVTLGTQKFEMNRLVEAVDRLAAHTEEEIFVQKGNSTYIPQNCKYADFVDTKKFGEMIKSCSVLITHSGVGSIMTGIRHHRPVIVVPRLSKYKEHVDDHQEQIAEAFANKNCVLYCKDLEELPGLIEEAKRHLFDPYHMKGGKIEEMILEFMGVSDT